jgi:hypothetical protein
MKFHAPESQSEAEHSTFAVKSNTLVHQEKVFEKKHYPSLPHDMVKITAQNGQKIYVSRHKLSSADY